jgi:hypothetical protein
MPACVCTGPPVQCSQCREVNAQLVNFSLAIATLRIPAPASARHSQTPSQPLYNVYTALPLASFLNAVSSLFLSLLP